MSYIGENEHFSFRDGSCEVLPNVSVSSAEAAELGRTLSRFFSRFSVGCTGFERLPVMYALCSGISECGRDVYVCENTDMPSFRFGLTLLSAECGIFISESGGLKFTFFDRSGFVLSDKILEEIMRSSPAQASEHTGRINSVTSFRSIYKQYCRFTGKRALFNACRDKLRKRGCQIVVAGIFQRRGR